MKKLFTLSLCSLFLFQLSAQDATFERFLSVKDSFLNGKTTAPSPQIFTDSGFIFSAVYDTSFGGYWANGFAISSMTDTVNGTAANLYSSASGEGSGGSLSYAVVQNNAQFTYHLAGTGFAPYLYSMDVNNTFYAKYVMKNGNQFAKKFNGTDKDSFTLWIYQYFSNNTVDSTRIDLANFTSNNSDEHYILDTWTTVRFNSTIPSDSIKFKLVSSDNGQFGMNTPAFFALDNVKLDVQSSSQPIINSELKIYPIPSNGQIFIQGVDLDDMIDIQVLDVQGKAISFSRLPNSIDLIGAPKGVYMLIMQKNDQIWQEKLIIR